MPSKHGLDFLVIGAMKSGTTTVHDYLIKHPQLNLAVGKEAPFFSRDDYFRRGLNWYMREFFPRRNGSQLLGAVSPQYMAYLKAAVRIRDTCDEIKLIAILRDPIARAVSHYKMAVRMSGEHRTFEDAVSYQLDEDRLDNSRKDPSQTNSYVVWGEYGRILNVYAELFGISNILPIFTYDLQKNPQATLYSITEFLGVSELFVDRYSEAANTSAGKGVTTRLAAELVHLPGVRKILNSVLRERQISAIQTWSAINRGVSRSKVVEIPPNIERALAVHYRLDSIMLDHLIRRPLPWSNRINRLVNGYE